MIKTQSHFGVLLTYISTYNTQITLIIIIIQVYLIWMEVRNLIDRMNEHSDMTDYQRDRRVTLIFKAVKTVGANISYWYNVREIKSAT